MGRFIFIFLVTVAAALLVVNGVSFDSFSLSSLDPRGVGTRMEGGEVVLDAGQLEARFSPVGRLDESYMLFGGDVQGHQNSIMHVSLAGLATHHARFIAERHPDFHMCSSPGAKPAQELTESMMVVAADRAALAELSKAVELFQERLGRGGERTCLRMSGAPLALDSVRLEDGDLSEDISHDVVPKFSHANFVLAESVQLEDCKQLLQ